MNHHRTIIALTLSLAVGAVAAAEEATAVAAGTAVRAEAPTASDLDRYTKGIPGRGALHADIVTNRGTLRCALHEDSAPITVANFVGLARGLQPWLDPGTKQVRDAQPAATLG